MRRLLALVAVSAALSSPGAGLAGDGQRAAVGQASQATAVAGTFVAVRGGTCFAGCPTIVVSHASAVAVSLNLAFVTQILNQIQLRP